MRFLFFPLPLLMILSPLQPASGQSLLAEKPEFHRLVPGDAVVEKLAGGFKFVEGPAWLPFRFARDVKEGVIGNYLVFSDIPADKMYRLDPGPVSVLSFNPEAVKPGQSPVPETRFNEAASVYREPSQHANGNFCDDRGELYTCEHGARRVSVTRRDGTVETLVDRFEGKAFNSPNDVVVKRDGTVWFSDPTYGLERRPKEQATNNVYCFDPKTHETRAVVTDFVQPNGLCFSPDERLLYIADSGHPPQQVRVFDVTADNRLENGRVFCEIDNGVPDGMRCDQHGNLFSTAGDGVQIFAPDGTRLGKILVPETPANLCFGGSNCNELFITARTSVYHVKLTTMGALAPRKQP